MVHHCSILIVQRPKVEPNLSNQLWVLLHFLRCLAGESWTNNGTVREYHSNAPHKGLQLTTTQFLLICVEHPVSRTMCYPAVRHGMSYPVIYFWWCGGPVMIPVYQNGSHPNAFGGWLFAGFSWRETPPRWPSALFDGSFDSLVVDLFIP